MAFLKRLQVRKISSGVGVERTFPLHTPKIEKIEVKRRGKVRRAKLYYFYVVYVVKLLESKKFVNQHLNKAMYESYSTQTTKPSRSLLWSDIDGFFCCLGKVKLIM